MTEIMTENKLLASLLLIAIAVVIRWLAVRYIRRMPSSDDDLPKRWMNAIRNAVTTLIVIGLVIIWLSELRFGELIGILIFKLEPITLCSKGDHSELGRRYKAPALQSLWPVSAYIDWTSTAQISVGPVFRSINR